MDPVFYRPVKASVGDVIPYYADGEFKIFYLQLWRDPEMADPGIDWYLLGTQDFIHYREYGSCQIPGGTGGVIEADGLYHLIYCIFPEGRQVICHATSTDLVHWEKHPEDDFGPDPDVYAPSDWRDPYLFWNEEDGQYWMLIAARTRSPYARGGCVGLCVSTDLKHWQARPPLYAPDLYISALECPDLFRMGDWWYLVYSSYTDRFATHYRMSRSLHGPWQTPPEDTFDGRAFYAARTVTDGSRRYVLGWNPTRVENHFDWNPPGYTGRDYNTWDWGGHLVVHEVVQAPDGRLLVRLPESVAAVFQREQPLTLQQTLGQWTQTGAGHTASAPYGFACATAGPLPACCLMSARFQFKPGTRGVGLILRASERLDKGYTLQFEPDRNRVVFKSYPFSDEHGGKFLPYEVELERPLTLTPDQSHSLKVVVEETVCELYVDDQIAMSMRMYDLPEGNLAFFVADGEATFEDISIKTRS